jgi:hypothetical protein
MRGGRNCLPADIGATAMRTFVLAASFVAVFAIAGCQSGPVQPVPSPSGAAGVPTASPPAPATPGPSVTARPSEPAPTAQPPAPVATPKPKPKPIKPTFNADEKYLMGGILRGAKDCVPVRDDLPARSRAGIECASDDRAVSRVGFYLFDRDEDMIAAYIARMTREGVELESGDACRLREGEEAYVPWEPGEIAPMRAGCFINAQGYANYRVTTGYGVYIGILGRNDDMGALADFAFRGSQDVPAFPTLWGLQ